MSDPTEYIRRVEQAIINQTPVDQLQIKDRSWTTEELSQEFDVLGFAAPYVLVERKEDSKKGSLQFKHSPRIYFNWQEE